MRGELASRFAAVSAARALGLALLAFCASATGAEYVQVTLFSSLAPGKELSLSVPKEYLSPRNAEELSQGIKKTESLYLVLRYIPDSKDAVTKASPRDLRYDAPGLTHIFLKIPVRPHQEDNGSWYLNAFLQTARRKGIFNEPREEAGSRVLRYEFGGPPSEIVYTYKDAASRTVTIRCFRAVCSGYRTWRGVVLAEYRYDRPTVKHFMEVDALIDRLLSDGYKGRTKQ
jgi:hypothetical protein